MQYLDEFDVRNLAIHTYIYPPVIVLNELNELQNGLLRSLVIFRSLCPMVVQLGCGLGLSYLCI